MLRRLNSLLILVPLVTSLAGCGKDPEVAKREFMRSGDAAVAQGKDAEALIHYRNAIAQDARYGEARLKLSTVYARTGNLAGALSEAIRAADLLPNSAEAQLKAGQMLMVARQPLEAQTRADKALKINPKLLDAQLLRASALAGLNKLDDAVAEMEDAIRNDPERTTVYANLGALQMVRGDRAQAEAAYRKAVAMAPASFDAHLALATYLWAVDRSKEAEDELKAAFAIDPKSLLVNRALMLFYLGSQRVKEAEPFLKTVAEISPDASGKLFLADYYIGSQRVPEGRRVLDALVAAGKDGAASAKIRLARLAYASGDVAGATRLVDEVVTKEPRNLDALLARADLFLYAGDPNQALPFAERARQVNPQSSAAQFSIGLIREGRREDQEAIAAFTESLKINPRLARSELELAKIHLRAGRLDEAAKFAQAAITKASGYVDAHVLLARINLRTGAVSKAEPSIRALAKALPNDPEVQAQLGQLEALKGNRPAARQAFQRALATRPTNVDALAGLVAMDLQDKHPDAAKARLDAALRLAPKSGELLLLAGRTYRGTADNAGAERFAQEAIQADPNNLEAYSFLGGLYFSTKRLDDGIALFRKVGEKQPKAVGPPTMVGMLFQMQNKNTEARASYEHALNIDSTAPVASNNLAWLLTEVGDNLDVALQLAKTAKAGLPDRPEVDDTLGWVYFKKGQFSLAVPAFLEAVAKSPTTPVSHYHLGLAYAGLGDTSKAKASLEKSLALDSTSKTAEEAKQALAKLLKS